MTQELNAQHQKRPKNLVLWGTLILVLLAPVITGFVLYFTIESWSDRGSFGDMFGLTTSLFSGLALGGVVYAILLQRKELALQREELKMTRAELARSAEAQQRSADLLNQQLQTGRRAVARENRWRFLEARPEVVWQSGPYDASSGRLDLELRIDGPPLRDPSVVDATDCSFIGLTDKGNRVLKLNFEFPTRPNTLPPFSFRLRFKDRYDNRRRINIMLAPPHALTVEELTPERTSM
jgi:hypothetical protein